MVSFTLVIGKKFLTKKYIEHNKSIVGENSDNAETQYWINNDVQSIVVEEMFFDSHDGDFTITIINQEKDSNESLFISLSIPIEEWALKLAEPDLTRLLDNLVSVIKKSKDRVDTIKAVIVNTD